MHKGLKVGAGRKNYLVNRATLATQEIGQQADQKTVEEKAGGFRFEVEVEHEDVLSFKAPLEFEEERGFAGLARADQGQMRSCALAQEALEFTGEQIQESDSIVESLATYRIAKHSALPAGIL